VLLNIALCPWPKATINQLLTFQHSNNSTNMLELNIKCATIEEARVVLNAQQYLNLIDDFFNALRTARKHGTEEDVLKIVDQFYPEMCNAIDNATGAY
jgi:hypothetical protein